MDRLICRKRAGAILKEDVVWDVVEETFEQRPLHLKSPIGERLVRDKSDDHQQDGENGSHADAARGSVSRVVGDEAAPSPALPEGLPGRR